MATQIVPGSELYDDPTTTSGLLDPEALEEQGASAALAARAERSQAPDRLTHVPEPRWAGVFQARAATRQDRAPSSIVTIVHHTPEGGEAGTLGVLNGDRAGFDFFVPRAGVVYKCNDFHRYTAWQAGNWAYNVRSVGIEIGDFAANSGSFPDALYREVAKLDAWLISTTGAQLVRATSFGQDGLIAHATITPATRTDPGSGFKWGLLMDMIREELGQPGGGTEPRPFQITWARGRLTAVRGAIARTAPTTQARILHALQSGATYDTDGFTDEGEEHDGSRRWYHFSASSGYGWVHRSGGSHANR
jgi:hypothetical protein